ncbi:hypothetical protein PUMCH_005081 [Australozyma saopauloensis]|uniref:JmjC domain-containing protein n=1 Tax=Australozyma saopauloensis TaxID=291208 RepID=A0AAX4HGS0_9ASCO|nr:hypothetical protein PUMCH_005081 [[Candida] saopauloensis]
MPGPTTTKKYTNALRTSSASYVAAHHPLNVRPLGNLLFEKAPEGLSKEQQLGDFASFPEELLMTILSNVDDPIALKALSHTSRVLYAYCYEEDLWKQLYISKLLQLEQNGQKLPELTWRGSWRLSVLQLDPKALADLQLADNLVCSDILFRPFQCSQVNYDKLFDKVIREEEVYHLDSLSSQFPLDKSLPHGRIPRLPEAYLTESIFSSQWSSKPFILTNPDKQRWPRWDMQSLLSRFGGVKFRQEAVQWPLSLFSQYLQNNKDESPLYLFDCNSEAMKTLRKEYTAANIFKRDLFTLFEDCRPDHAWLIIGSQRSGSTFHKDPNNTSAWNTALSGRKLWVMFPPDVIPPGVSTDEEESEVTSPVGLAEWVLSGFYNDSVKLQDSQIGITFPGECMYVPSGWWHAVINLDDSVALTQNFVPEVKLGSVLHFFKNRNKQISGFRPARVRSALETVLAEIPHKAGSENYEAIKLYCEMYDEKNIKTQLQDEDCGEILESQLPPMPIFELFSELLCISGQQDLLEEALVETRRMEKADQRNLTGKSEAWTELSTSTGGFSFGFDFEEE